MNKQGGFFEEVVCDSYSHVCDSNERLKEYLEGALSKAGLESFVTVMPRRDGYRLYTGEKPDAPFAYVDVYLDGESLVVEGSSKRNLSESEMGDLSRFLGISGKEAGEKLNKFRRFIDALQKHAGEDVDKLEDLRVSDAVSVDAGNRKGSSPVCYVSGQRIGRSVSTARPSGGVKRAPLHLSKVDGGSRIGKPVSAAKVSDSKAGDISKLSGALKLVKENFKSSGKPAEIKGLTLELKALGGAVVSVKAYSKDKEPKITVEARTSDGKRRGFDYGIDAKASHVYGDLVSLGKVSDSKPVRWYQGRRIGDSVGIESPATPGSALVPLQKAWDRLRRVANIPRVVLSLDYMGDSLMVVLNREDNNIIKVTVNDKPVGSFDLQKDTADYVFNAIVGRDTTTVGDRVDNAVSDSADRSDWFEVISKRLHEDSKFTVEDDTEDLVSGYYMLGDDNEGHISLHPDKIVFYAYEDPTDTGSDPLEISVPFTFYNKVESVLALLYFVQATDDAYDYVDVVRTVKKVNHGVSDSARIADAEDGLSWFEKLSRYLHDDVAFTIEDDKEALISGYYKLSGGNEGHISLHPDKLVFSAYVDPTNVDSDPLEYTVLPTDFPNFDSYLGLLSFVKGSGDAKSFVDLPRSLTRNYRVGDSSDAPRTDCVFPKDSPDVNDGKCHFPLNSLARGRAALAYASHYKELPKWYSGSMSLDEFVKHIADEVKKAYPSIDVTAAGEEAGAQTK